MAPINFEGMSRQDKADALVRLAGELATPPPRYTAHAFNMPPRTDDSLLWQLTEGHRLMEEFIASLAQTDTPK